MKGLSIEVRVGLMILVAVAIAVAIYLTVGKVSLGSGYTIYVDFNNPGGVQKGAAVQVANVRVGQVDDIEYWGGRLDEKTNTRPIIRLKLNIEKKVQPTIHTDARFYVAQTSIVGESYIAIDPGDPEKPFLKNGAVVRGIDPPRMDLAFSMAFDLLGNINDLVRDNREELNGMLTSLANTFKSVDVLLTRNGDRIDRMMENVEDITVDGRATVKDVRGIIEGPHVKRSIKNADHVLDSVSKNIDPILADTRQITGKVNTTLDDVAGPSQRKQIQKIIANGEEITDKAKGLVSDATDITRRIHEGKGTVGAILMDEQLYDDIQEMVRDLKHNPWKLFWRE